MLARLPIVGPGPDSENFAFTNIPGKDPVVVFVDDQGSPLESIAVDKMTTVEIVELLEARGFQRKPVATVDAHDEL